MIDWWDLPSLFTFKGYGANFGYIGKAILDSADWLLNLN